VHRFKNILVLLGAGGGKPAPLGPAEALARRNGARLTLMAVLERLPPGPRAAPAAGRPEAPVQADVLRELRADLRRLAAPLEGEGLSVGTRVRRGRPSLEAIRDVLRHGRDIVFVEAGADFHGSWLGGAVAELMRRCPCPVWAVQRDERRPRPRILAALDPDPDDPLRDSLNTRVLELASSLARIEGGELSVVHAWQVEGEGLLRGLARAEVADLVRYARDAHDLHARRLEEVLERFDVSDVAGEIYLPKGDPGVVIPELAERLHAQVVVMGTLSRGGIAGFFLGNTAETVLRHGRCDVLTVKPAGFECPVRLASPVSGR